MLAIMAGCNNYDSFVVTEKPYVNQTSVQLYVGEHAGDRNTVQLVSSPSGKSYIWTSQDPSVVTVNQTGLLTAVGEGITTVTVASADDQIIIDVNVKEYIPLTGFILSTHSVISFWQNTTQVFVTYIPDNATDVNIEWTSSDREVAEVYSNGLVKTLEEGRATITAKYGDIEQTVDVWVPAPPMKMNKSGWSIPGYNPNSDDGTIGYSSQQRSDGGGIPSIIDDNLNTYWHARWGGTPSKYPHWFIIDLGEEVTIAQVGMARRTGDGRGQKGYQVFTCTENGAVNLNDPTSWDWEDQGDISFDSGKDGIQIQPLSKFPIARYIKVFIAEKYRGSNDFAMVGDFSVYIFKD
ncbi:Ig-like domain-containing protein [uncultured Proteiniphilum sp.]|uniref:Ig-like domain-containing protein n=1 Tax=uncultured Proteiniphilum sp. TaxID=497637 RepID=UPI00261F33B2|nr:Ig-like domain-containing protein [uncultured Proteiniphilum sp.]